MSGTDAVFVEAPDSTVLLLYNSFEFSAGTHPSPATPDHLNLQLPSEDIKTTAAGNRKLSAPDQVSRHPYLVQASSQITLIRPFHTTMQPPCSACLQSPATQCHPPVLKEPSLDDI